MMGVEEIVFKGVENGYTYGGTLTKVVNVCFNCKYVKTAIFNVFKRYYLSFVSSTL